jgi:hypothetical protein
LQTHSRIIIQKFIHRELIRVSAQTLSEAYNEGNDVFDMLNNANNTFYKINYEIENINTMPLDVMAINYIQRRKSMHSKEGNLLYTGFSEWDKLNGALFRGGIYFIAGRREETASSPSSVRAIRTEGKETGGTLGQDQADDPADRRLGGPDGSGPLPRTVGT